ncbi:MAG TPA: type II toxin-antitoxin system PemK/MazF family toxin [Roseomonas sp.]|nr:type II toxin-antitoxin system PemK/MazF family toxin [Roseomonas sp.]
MIQRPYVPERGDIVLIASTPKTKDGTAGEHFGIVLSEAAFSAATGWMVVCPITREVKFSPFEVRIPPGLRAVGCVVASEMHTLDYIEHRTRFMERAPLGLLQEVQAIACATIGCS